MGLPLAWLTFSVEKPAVCVRARSRYSVSRHSASSRTISWSAGADVRLDSERGLKRLVP